MPGPDEEVRNVERIYHWFVDDGCSNREIAARLNAEGMRTDLGRDWTRATVHEVLTNEKYIGNNVFNRISFKLKKKRVVNPPEMWIRKEGAFEGIVSPSYSTRPRGSYGRTRRYSDEELLERLRTFIRIGAPLGLIINETDGMPSPSVYTHRFGSLDPRVPDGGIYAGYGIIGILRSTACFASCTRRSSHRRRRKSPSLGGAVSRDPATDLLRVNAEFTVSLVLARCQIAGGWSKSLEGALRYKPSPRHHGRGQARSCESNAARLLPIAAT